MPGQANCGGPSGAYKASASSCTNKSSGGDGRNRSRGAVATGRVRASGSVCRTQINSSWGRASERTSAWEQDQVRKL